jgi:hypothetical protein
MLVGGVRRMMIVSRRKRHWTKTFYMVMLLVVGLGAGLTMIVDDN